MAKHLLVLGHLRWYHGSCHASLLSRDMSKYCWQRFSATTTLEHLFVNISPPSAQTKTRSRDKHKHYNDEASSEYSLIHLHSLYEARFLHPLLYRPCVCRLLYRHSWPVNPTGLHIQLQQHSSRSLLSPNGVRSNHSASIKRSTNRHELPPICQKPQYHHHQRTTN